MYDNIYVDFDALIVVSRGSRYSLLLKGNSLLVKMSHDCLCVGSSQVRDRVCSILW